VALLMCLFVVIRIDFATGSFHHHKSPLAKHFVTRFCFYSIIGTFNSFSGAPDSIAFHVDIFFRVIKSGHISGQFGVKVVSKASFRHTNWNFLVIE
jgi:hypothetical protein